MPIALLMLKARVGKALAPLVIGTVALTGLMVLLGTAVTLVRHDAVKSRDGVWKLKLGSATALAKEQERAAAAARADAEAKERQRAALETEMELARRQKADLERDIERLRRDVGNPLLYKAEKTR